MKSPWTGLIRFQEINRLAPAKLQQFHGLLHADFARPISLLVVLIEKAEKTA